MADFFKPKEEEPTPTEQKFTIGDKEYTQDELNDLVSKGNQYSEIETKFNTKLDKVVPDYTRASMEASEWKKKYADLEQAQLREKMNQGAQLSPDEIRMRARQEAVNLGLMTDETTPALIRAEIAGYELRKETDSVVGELDEMGIKADPKIILKYMDAADLDNPQDAVDQLYGGQIKNWQAEQLNKQKPEGLYAERGSEAGGFKLPEDVKVNDGNLMELFKQAVGGGD